ncbi:hypothetical protein [Streptomyces alkaliterrae]|uniref:Lipoprotein n=1 Tax=Streptomyces alkaliterrae TaxID=2213162 RepID=A0A5P0YYN3_9ACTN|nr:hypothetical protein [Streptomyces alkaliterrae]MBB1256867.1 hypothetical protein [Streptomyces alkaliterrae]MBB1259264.1 hypothetical protein [Streptomyces alkaliterrae]MQS05405.1 hypothetical protein [Streptomyces alkaliterrae]
MIRGRTAMAGGLLAALLAASTGCGGSAEPAAPEVDAKQWAKVRPVVHEALLAEAREEGEEGRWICEQRPLEIEKRDGGELRVSLLSYCQQYLRKGDGLVEQTGWMAPAKVRVAADGDGYRVRGVWHAGLGSDYTGWLDQEFSAGARAEVHRRAGSGWPDLAGQARKEFGLPADAEVAEN